MATKAQFGMLGRVRGKAIRPGRATRGSGSLHLLRLLVLVVLSLVASATVSTVAFAGAQEDTTLTTRVVNAVEEKVQKLWEKGEKFVNDLRLLSKVKDLAEKGESEAKPAAEPVEGQGQKAAPLKQDK